MSTANSQETLGLGKHSPQTINNLWSTKIPGFWQPLALKSNSTAGANSSPEMWGGESIATCCSSVAGWHPPCAWQEKDKGKTGLCSLYPNGFANWDLSLFSTQIGNHYRVLAMDHACVCLPWIDFCTSHTGTCTHTHIHIHAHMQIYYYCPHFADGKIEPQVWRKPSQDL